MRHLLRLMQVILDQCLLGRLEGLVLVVSSLDRLVVLVGESFVSLSLLICIVGLVGFLVLLRHVYRLYDIVHYWIVDMI
ncbi:hypothetical protein KCU71_g120, partial [Aureobasidium melanogenum]